MPFSLQLAWWASTLTGKVCCFKITGTVTFFESATIQPYKSSTLIKLVYTQTTITSKPEFFRSISLNYLLFGEMGALDYVSDLLAGGGSKHKKRKEMKTVELKVRMDCDGCELKVKNAASSIKGVKSVDINRKQQKVTVTGYVEPNKVLKKVKATGKRAEIWPYVPYGLVAQPYTAQVYDKKAPSGYVRRVQEYNSVPNPNSEQEHYTTLFSEDNPNACSVM